MTSMLDGVPPMEGAGESGEAGATGATGGEGVTGSADPFGDLSEYKDAESGLYLGKYKTPREAFEGYKELSSRLREKQPEAPEKIEDYVFEFSDEALKPHAPTLEDPGWKAMAPVFKEANVSREQAQKIVEGFIQYNLSQQPDLEKEKAKLGPEAETILKSVVTYAQKRGSDGMQVLAQMAGQSAETLQELHFLIQQAQERTIPKDLSGRSAKTAQELKAEAFEYYEQHKTTIDSNPDQQKIYDNKLRAAIQAGAK